MLPLSDAQVDNRITAYAVCYLDAAYKSIQAKKYGDTACATKEYRIMVYLMWAQSMMKRYKAGCITADDACFVMQRADPVCSKCQCGGAPTNPITPVPPCDIHFDRSVGRTVDAADQALITGGGPFYIVSNIYGSTESWGLHVGYIVETNGTFTPIADGAIIYDQTSTVFWTSTPTNVPGQYFPDLSASVSGVNLMVTSPYPAVNELYNRNVTVEALVGGNWTTVYGPATEQVFATAQTYTTASEATAIRTTYSISTCNYGPYEDGSPTLGCSGDGMMSVTFSDDGGYLYADTDTGYFALRSSDGSLTVYNSGDDNYPPSSTYCMWSSDASGTQSGSLTALYLSSTAITTIDVSANTALTTLYLSSTAITTIDVSANTALTYLDLSSTAITTIDVSANTALTVLYLSSTAITTIDVSANTALTYLGLSSTAITAIDVSANTALTDLILSSTAITAIDVSANTALTVLYLSSTAITAIDVSANTALTYLGLSSTAITTIDVSANTALTDLILSSCTSLISLDAHGLIYLLTCDIEGCSSLNSLNMSGCALSQSLLNSILVILDGLGRTDVVADFSGGTTPHPTSTGLTAYNNLLTKGCTITVNP